MNTTDLVDFLSKNGFGGNSAGIYTPYRFNSTKTAAGVPPVPIEGLDYIWARHKVPQVALVMGLTGTGLFLQNRNQSGIVEFGLMNGAGCIAALEMFQLTGIPFPVTSLDTACQGSGIIALECRRVETPEWRRAKFPSLDIYTFETPRLMINWGIRLPNGIF